MNWFKKLLPPKIAARLLLALKLRGQETVLEVGTGTGYMTTLLSRLADEVITIEIDKTLMQEVQKRLAAEGCQNVEFLTGDIMKNAGMTKNIDAIIVGGALSTVPAHLFDMLSHQGRLVAVLGEEDDCVMQAVLYRKCEGGQDFQKTILFETWVTPLAQHSHTQPFEF